MCFKDKQCYIFYRLYYLNYVFSNCLQNKTRIQDGWKTLSVGSVTVRVRVKHKVTVWNSEKFILEGLWTNMEVVSGVSGEYT